MFQNQNKSIKILEWYNKDTENKFFLLAAGRPTRGVHIEKQNVRVVDFVDIRHHNLSLIADLSSGRGDAHIDKVSSDNRDN